MLDAVGNVVGLVVENYRNFDFRNKGQDDQDIDIFNIAQNINFAVSLKAIKNFLKEAGVEPYTSSEISKKEWTEVAEIAEKFTVPILCFEEK